MSMWNPRPEERQKLEDLLSKVDLKAGSENVKAYLEKQKACEAEGHLGAQEQGSEFFRGRLTVSMYCGHCDMHYIRNATSTEWTEFEKEMQRVYR